MSSSTGKGRSIDFRASRLLHFWGYLAGLVLIPAAGIGFVLLWRLERNVARIGLTLEDRRVRIRTGLDPRDPEAERIVDASAILRVETRPLAPPAGWLGVETLVLHAGAGDIRVPGLKQAGRIRKALEAIVAEAAERKRKADSQRPRGTLTKPGSTDQLNELTLLWQQGLITDEEFDAQKRNFS